MRDTMKASGWEPEEVEEIPERPKEEVPVPDVRVESAPARMRIFKSDLEKHGYTPGCLGCRQVFMGSKKNGGHNEQCRARMYPLLINDDSSKHRFESAEARRQDWNVRKGTTEDVEAKRRKLEKEDVSVTPSIPGADKRDMVRDALGDLEHNAKKARIETEVSRDEMQDFIDQDFGNEEDMFRNTENHGNEQRTTQQTG